jgi:hypothetical protein
VGNYISFDEKAALSRLRAEAKRREREALEAATNPSRSYYAALPVVPPAPKTAKPPKPKPSPLSPLELAALRLEQAHKLRTEMFELWRADIHKFWASGNNNSVLVYFLARYILRREQNATNNGGIF